MQREERKSSVTQKQLTGFRGQENRGGEAYAHERLIVFKAGEFLLPGMPPPLSCLPARDSLRALPTPLLAWRQAARGAAGGFS